MASNIETDSVENIKADAALEGWDGKPDLDSSELESVGLDTDELLEIYRLMYLSRRLDDAQVRLQTQQEVFFQIAGAGHEAALVAAGRHLKPGHDWFYPYYRDLGLALTIGVTPTEVLAQGVGSSEDPASGGRQMPHHWGKEELNLVTQSSPTGTQILQAVGAAEVGKICQEVERLRDDGVAFEDDEVVYVSIGDGASSEGEFWEGLGHASNEQLPVLFLIEDNDYAISVPKRIQIHGGDVADTVEGFDHLYTTEFDGCDPVESYRELGDAIEYIREGHGPALAHAHVIRPYSHSVSDDDKAYKTEEEREAEKARDPIDNFPEYLIDNDLATDEELQEIREAVDDEIDAAVDEALDLPEPDPNAYEEYVYSPDLDATDSSFESTPDWDDERGDQSMVDLLNETLHTEMERDPRIVVFGEDVADVSNDENIDEVKGKGGVFKVTHGLQKKFGRERCFNSPLAEANIVGRGIGMATRGLRPVVEIQFFDYIWPAFMQMRNEMSNIRWRSNNAFEAPLVVRVPIGGYLKGGAPYHSQSGTTLFTQTPGIRIALPSTAADANGLLRTAIRCEDPVLFLEPKHLYRQTHNQNPPPGDDYTIPFGEARTVQEGEDLTVVTYGNTVHRSVQAAEKTDADVEIIDLRTLSPFDWETISRSVKKTNKVMVVYEDNLSWGYGTEIATKIGDELFEYLDGPVQRVASDDTFVAYHPDMEYEILPQPEDIREQIEWLYKY